MGVFDDRFPAVGRDVGKVDTDSSGLARYSLKLQIPAGIKYGNEPEISLEYCQGCPNGSLGLGWALGGASCIRRGAASLAYDGVNSPPPGYSRFQPKLLLDGVELLCIQGTYDAADAAYVTELDNQKRTVTSLQGGYLVIDSAGRRTEYGTSTDSRVVLSGSTTVREWRMKKQIDIFGNTVTYNYVATPQVGGTVRDLNTCYISNIRYSSNDKQGLAAGRIVCFEYTARDDLIVQTVQGERTVWSQLLTAIRVGVVRGDVVRTDRSYELTYGKSDCSGDSCLQSVTECTGTGSGKISLLPTTFSYIKDERQPSNLFKTVPQDVTELPGTNNAAALFTMNVTGRALADIAVVQWDTSSNRMSVKTYPAIRKEDGSISWKGFDGPSNTATLPPISIAEGFPSILTPDMNGDGRSDLIIPFKDNSRINFSVSQSIGIGYKDHFVKTTPFAWTPFSKFMALDLNGRGVIDIVQIYQDEQKLNFRNFSGAVQDGQISVGDAKSTATQFAFTGTIDWFVLSHVGTAAKSLVRVWGKDTGTATQICTTAFKSANPDSSGTGFDPKGVTSVLLELPTNTMKYSVLPCDINGDGVQDLVLATTKWAVNKMVITFQIFLGDGNGSFQKLGAATSFDVLDAKEPIRTTEYGQFHLTNLNGTNYPSLSFVYQELDSKAFACITSDGRCDGSLTKPTLSRFGQGVSMPNPTVVPVDVNGNGLGDWLMYTMDKGPPRVLPVYNTASTVDYLASTTDPMGLKTTLTYDTLTNPAVYHSSVSDWKKYVNDTPESYPVLGAPNNVVTTLTHTNDPAINSFHYEVKISKTYGSARVSNQGRGWLGFGEINTLNATSHVLTTEKYLQQFPLLGLKCQIDTKTPDNQILKTEKTQYEMPFTMKGPWKVFRTNKTLDQVDVLDDGRPSRTNAISWEYDGDGNPSSKMILETQNGVQMNQYWQRYTYTTVDGITGLLATSKITANAKSADLTHFEPGDKSFTKHEYDSGPPRLKTTSEWSTDLKMYAVKSFVFDQYGNEIKNVDAAGLETTTTYDETFKTFPVKVEEKGPGVSLSTFTAYDEASGFEVAKLDPTGLLMCHRRDGFGRITETRLKSASSAGGVVISGSSFFADWSFIADAAFTKTLGTISLDPYRNVHHERSKGATNTYISSTTIQYHKDGADGQNEVVEAMDCIKQVRKRSNRQGMALEKIWLQVEYDARGSPSFESYPTKAPSSTTLDWTADSKLGISSSYDALGRNTLQSRPSHTDPGRLVLLQRIYRNGGSSVEEQTLSSTNLSSPLTGATLLSSLQKHYVRFEQGDQIVEQMNQNKLKSTFQYNPFGELVQCIDPKQGTESRSYNNLGKIISINNQYQNVLQKSGSNAAEYHFDIAGRLVSQVNALGETITYERDPKGRLKSKTGADGRIVKFEYDQSGQDKLSSVVIYPHGISSSFEIKYGFTYDHLGRLKDRSLSLADGSTYTTSMAYDWQGQLVKKTQPDGSTLLYDYVGANVHTGTMSGNSTNAWLLKADIQQSNAFEKPEKLSLQGTGVTDAFMHEWKYDTAGFPSSHALASGSHQLVQESYSFNDLDQMISKQESIAKAKVDYVYDGRRLASSQAIGGAKNVYTFNEHGDLLTNRGTTLTYSQGRVVGNHDGTVAFDVSYDGVGRVSTRIAGGLTSTFAYDSFGKLKSLKDSSGHSIELVTDHDGEVVQRKRSDGSYELIVGADFTIDVQANATRTVHHKLFIKNNLLGTVSHRFESSKASTPLANSRVTNIFFADTKGTVTQIINGDNITKREKFEYDDYGLIKSETRVNSEQVDNATTYEGKVRDDVCGLLDFKARWYDPLVGRFTSPDDILDIAALLKPDGLNRYVFENNDPINNIDPSGHISWNSISGIILSGALLVAAAVVIGATGGAATPLVAAGVGALIGGGVAGLTYSIDHRNEENGGKFWAGFAATVAVNAAIGAATGAFGAYATSAKALSATSSIASKAGWALSARSLNLIAKVGLVGSKGLLGGVGGILSNATNNIVGNTLYNRHDDVFKGSGAAFFAGGIAGLIGGGAALYQEGAAAAKTGQQAAQQSASLGELIKKGVGYTVKPIGGLAGLGYHEYAIHGEAYKSGPEPPHKPVNGTSYYPHPYSPPLYG